MSMLDLIGIIFVAVVISIDLVAILTTLRISLPWKIAASGAAGAWIALAVIAGITGSLQIQGVRLAMFALPLLAFAAAMVLSRPFRGALLAIPSPMLIGLNAARVFGFLFLMLESAGRLSGPFPHYAGWGDIITGALAIPLAWSAAKNPGPTFRYVIAWNVFGLADLLNAVSLAVLSTNGSSLQVIHAGAGAAAMATLPWALAPTFLVPFYFVTHIILFVRSQDVAVSRAHERSA